MLDIIFLSSEYYIIKQRIDTITAVSVLNLSSINIIKNTVLQIHNQLFACRTNILYRIRI
jgi:hypothetical protein